VISVAELPQRLFTWYRENKRDLPWRRTKDPYAIWLSEIMLQQTRVETVIPYYDRFLAAYPTVQSLAEAPLEDVLTKWSGLGYYRRARTLHAAAQQVSRERGGIFPREASELREIGGIGPYTAGAVASIAFDRAAALVDGNVARVFARIFAVNDDVRKPAGNAKIWKIAEELVPKKNPGDYNQALMELGALICTPRAPRCLLCPVHDLCEARNRGLENDLPIMGAKKAPRAWSRAALVVQRAGEVLLVKRRGDRLFGGMWEPPAVDVEKKSDRPPRALEKMVGLKDVEYTEKEEVKHVLSHRKMDVAVFAAHAKKITFVPTDEYDEARWVSLEALAELPTSTLCKKILAAAAWPAPAKSISSRRPARPRKASK
jgi:A/G-specific adenine glycosylase